ncbi:hypothetical protein SLEP1_g20781 [Rubroshorea leprosula]|uniref:Phospholipid/glycerol acyltransferase domain-containing protein n=1 Tax=Rubroshorea leprosula TaxID=152421 RepID=A0AAV5J9W4_9ROSI|nr:hypothetical protein SLEP1_g20781 [Rubroshorea leprosula]
MATKSHPLRALVLFESYIRNSVRSSHPQNATQLRFQKHALDRSLLSNKTMIFHLEDALLKSSSLFPYFMLVAFQAGGLFRALALLLLYPLVLMAGKELATKIMVFVCFVGIRKHEFKIGNAVLPKFFLEDVGWEGFDVVMSCERRIAVSDLPSVMVEGFVKDYLGIEAVCGRGLKVVNGYFVGLMEETKEDGVVNELFFDKKTTSRAIGFGCCNCNSSLHRRLFSHCKVGNTRDEVYLVTEADKGSWKILPRAKYPKPLIFHDGRLAFRPTPLATLVMFMWLPFGFVLCIMRYGAGKLLAYKLQSSITAWLGIKTTTSKLSDTSRGQGKAAGGKLYVCNHRTLLDPVFLSIVLMKPITAVTYSLSKFSEVISPIKTVRLTRNREKDRNTMERMLRKGNLVVCPEGTTCREPYLLRFSPLFAEITDEIVPIAIDVQVSMFYGSTASGHKGLDSVFHLINPNPRYYIKILDRLPSSYTCSSGGKSRVEVANHVQQVIAEANGFQCTSLTRKDKYKILAGNDGTV